MPGPASMKRTMPKIIIPLACLAFFLALPGSLHKIPFAGELALLFTGCLIIAVAFDFATKPWQRKQVREQYVIEQKGMCIFCHGSLMHPPPQEIEEVEIHLELFPDGFLNHLQHNHDTTRHLKQEFDETPEDEKQELWDGQRYLYISMVIITKWGGILMIPFWGPVIIYVLARHLSEHIFTGERVDEDA